MIYLLISAGPDSVFAAIHPVMRRIEIMLFMFALLIQAAFLIWHRLFFPGVVMYRVRVGLTHLRMPWQKVFATNPKHQLEGFAKKNELDHAEQYISYSIISDLGHL